MGNIEYLYTGISITEIKDFLLMCSAGANSWCFIYPIVKRYRLCVSTHLNEQWTPMDNRKLACLQFTRHNWTYIYEWMTAIKTLLQYAYNETLMTLNLPVLNFNYNTLTFQISFTSSPICSNFFQSYMADSWTHKVNLVCIEWTWWKEQEHTLKHHFIVCL